VIRRLAREKGVELAELVTEEDVSGKTEIDRRELGRLIRKIEAGESEGLVVWRVTRYSRDFVDGVLSAERVRKAGGRIIAEDVDTAMPMARGIMALLLDVAENELDNRRAMWKRAVDGAVARGVWVGPPPFGFRRGKDGILVVHPEEAEHVRYAFRARARGDSWRQLTRALRERGADMSIRGAQSLIKNRAHRGEIVRADGAHNPKAHDAIVDEKTWQSAQRDGKRPAWNGTISGRGLLTTLVMCGGCGRPMQTNGTQVTSYTCKQRVGTPCPAPASISVSRLDNHVLPGIKDRVSAEFDHAAYEADLADAQEAIIRAEESMQAFLTQADPAILGDAYSTESARWRQGIRDAQTRLREVETHRTPSGRIPLDPNAWEEYPIDERRLAARALIESVRVTKSPRQGSYGNLAERVTISWRD
jgi:DNA invertase Pin-like site-specific DNA recombinase